MLDKFFPKFKTIDGLNLVGLRNGHMLAQTPAYAENKQGGTFPVVASKTVGDYKFIENGIIVGLGTAGVMENYDPETHPVPFLHFTEELVDGPLDGNSRFAVETKPGVPAYPRCIALYVGDSWITDNVAGDLNTAGVFSLGVVDGILTIGQSGGFIGTKTIGTLGNPAVEITYVGEVATEIDIADAPSTAGRYYVRQAGTWVDISEIFLADADEDGKLYGRQNGEWIEIEQAFVEDVVNGDPAKVYGRQDGDWVEIE